MASTNKGRFFSMSDAWARNEAMVKRLDQQEGHYEGTDKAPSQTYSRPRADGSVQAVEYAPNAVLGLDSDHFHMGGEHVTNLKEERLANGDVHVYWQKESGGTYVTRHVQDGERGYRQVTKPKRVFTF